MLNQPADAATVNNTDGNHNNTSNNTTVGDTSGKVERAAPKIIAPIRLPGILSRGTNDPAVPEEPVIENVVDEGDNLSSTNDKKVTEKVESDEDNVDDDDDDNESDDNKEEETVTEETETDSKPIKVLGKTFKSLEAAEIYVNKQLAIARGAQSKTAKEANEFKQRLAALEETVSRNNGNKALDTNINVDPDTEQFYNDVKATEAYIETVKDPAERARLRTILVGVMVQNEVQKVEDRFSKLLAEKVDPIENERKAVIEQSETLNKAKVAFATVRDLVDDGNNLPAYPELNDATDLGEIVTMWNQFKESGQIGDKILYHPDFVMTLIHSYRDLKRSKAGTAKSTSEVKAAPVNTKKKAPSTHNLPPNLTKGNGSLGFTIPGVMGRR